ncbi:DUF6197 family protein [Hydrogenophaga sp.]
MYELSTFFTHNSETKMIPSSLRLIFAGTVLTLGACASLPAPQPSLAENAISCSLPAAKGSFKGSCEVSCSVNALAINFDGVESKRACTGPDRTVEAEVARTTVPGRWLGAMQGVKPEDPTRFEIVPSAQGGGMVGRTPFGWFAITEMSEADGVLRLRMNAQRQVRPNAEDIAIIARAIELLPSNERWNKNDDRKCPPGQRQLSMFCALQQATTEISGGVHYRQPALQAVREVLNTVDPARIKTHRIMDFNNHPDTTLAEVHALMRKAQSNLEKDIR